MSESPSITDANDNNFQQLVVEKSQAILVLVDFWADWCGPCQALAPMLDKLANQYQGKIALVKVNTDQQTQLAQQYGIRSLPTVHIYKNGQVVDQFMGALPESQIKTIIDRHLPNEADFLLEEALTALTANHTDKAIERLEKAHQLDSTHLTTIVTLAELYIHAHRYAETEALIKTVSIRDNDHPEILNVKAHLQFAVATADAPSITELTQTINDNPQNGQALYQLACQYALEKNYQSALASFLRLMQTDRKFQDDAGRKGLLAIFNLLGNHGDLVHQYRAKMATILH